MITQKKNTSSLWRNRDFLLLWSGQTVSMIGSGVSELAFPLLILALTHSPAQAGLVGALRTLPYFIFTLPGGVLVDRWDRKWMMIICDAGRALSLFSIPLALALGQLSLLQIGLVAFIEGTLFVFFDLANTASIPQVVAKEHLSAAIAQNQMTFGLTSFLSPPIGTLLYSISRPLPFLADAISYIASVVSLLFIRTPFQQERTVSTRNAYGEMVEGIRWLWHQPLLRLMALLNCGLSGFSWGLPLLLIVILQQYHASATTIGILFALIGIGHLLGSPLAPMVQKRFSYGLAVSVLFWLYPLTTILFTLTPNVIIMGTIFLMLGIVDSIYNVVQFSYRLAMIPDKLQGRANSAFRLISFSTRPLGIGLTGVLIQQIKAVPTLWIIAAALAALALITTLSPHIRKAPPAGMNM